LLAICGRVAAMSLVLSEIAKDHPVFRQMHCDVSQEVDRVLNLVPAAASEVRAALLELRGAWERLAGRREQLAGRRERL